MAYQNGGITCEIASEDINDMAVLLLKEERCSRMALLESFFQVAVFSFLTWLCSYSLAFQLSLLSLLLGNMQGIPYIPVVLMAFV